MDQIEKKILGLKQSGYEIRFPGGSGFSKRSSHSHASFGALVRKNDKVAEVLVVPYLNSYRNRKKEEGLEIEEEFSFSEDPAQTLVRELLEETGVLVRHSGITLMKEKVL